MVEGEPARLTRAIAFAFQLLRASGASVRRLRLTLAQLYAAILRTCVPMALGGLFVGAVLAVQDGNALNPGSGASALGALLALPLVLAALLFAGTFGSGLAAEIGRLKASEQLAALELMAVDPYRRVFAPRLGAGLLAMPLLAALFIAAGLGGGYLVVVGLHGVEAGAYWSQVQVGVELGRDLGAALLKSVIFGAAVTWIALFEGFDAEVTAEGMSRATTRAVVRGSLAVLGLELILNALLFAP